MSKKKVMIIGADGQLAFDLDLVFSSSYEVIKVGHQELDVVNLDSCKKIFAKFSPDIVINTAAYHKTSDCELYPDKSFAVNAVGAFNCSKAAREVGALVVFISSDYVFDGSKKYFRENDFPNPLNVYGASKLAGEALTKIGNPQHYIIRTSWLYGKRESKKGHNFVYLMLNKTKSEKMIRVVSDQFGCPTYTHDLAYKIEEIINKKLSFGIYHIVNSGYCSWYDFAKRIFEFKNIKIKLIACTSEEYSSSFKRPVYSVLSTKKLEKSKLEKLRPWDKALRSFLKELKG